jgi:hypothetical protein
MILTRRNCRRLLIATFSALVLSVNTYFLSNATAFSYEQDIDRPGEDYKYFDLYAPDYRLCMQACENDPKCKAYTYVKPGIQGPNARCWLKMSVPPARSNPCCISGVKHIPDSIEQKTGCGTGHAPGDEIIHFRVLNKTGPEVIIEVDYAYNAIHGNQVHLGAYLLDEYGEPLSIGFFPATAPIPHKGEVVMKVRADKVNHRVRSTELFIWMYEPYRSEGFVCRRFPYVSYWN